MTARTRWIWITALIAACAFPLLYPSKIPFGSDETELLKIALRCNAQRTLASEGLAGSLHGHYGPVPIWMYQLILAITHNPIAIVLIHPAIVRISLVFALAWIARTLQLWRWGIFALLMSPLVWIYSRTLWDNTLNIPLGAISIAAYAAFLQTDRRRQLALAIFVAGFMLLVHLMAAPILLAILLHLLIRRTRDLRRSWMHIAGAMFFVALIGIRYLPNLFHFTHTPPYPSSPHRFWFALLGPRALSAAWIEYFFAAGWLKSNFAWSCAFSFFRAISLLAFPLTWLGLIIGVRAMFARGESISLATEIAILCALAILLQIILNIATNTFGHPHYYNGTWAAFAVAMWIGLDRIAHFKWGRWIGWIQITAVSAISILLLARTVQTSGTQAEGIGAPRNYQSSEANNRRTNFIEELLR